MIHFILARKCSNILLSGERYGSVGIWTDLSYDKSAFTCYMKRFYGYMPHSEDFRLIPETGQTEYIPPCGSDEERIEFHLTPLKRGIFKIRKIKKFRGNIEKKDIHYVFVI